MEKVISLAEFEAGRYDKRYYELLEKAINYGLPAHEQQEIIEQINERESNVQTLIDGAQKLMSTAKEVSEQHEKDVKELIEIINNLQK